MQHAVTLSGVEERAYIPVSDIKAVGLFSGGLDSILAVKLIKDQGIAVDALNYNIGFGSLHLDRRAKKLENEVTFEEIEQQLGVAIQRIDVAKEFLSVLFHPKHGYGAAMNPCIDCKIFLMKKAREYMEAHHAHFVFTGEVVGQRPMSQKFKTMRQIENASGLAGYLLRPLSAKILEPTIPEQRGWVDRDRLLDITGRSRMIQRQLAQQYHLRYPQPSGGCLLTDENFAKRLRELKAHKAAADIMPHEIELLKVGRHFRLSETVKIIVGRDEIDNTILENYLEGRWSAEARDYQGPLLIIDGDPVEEQYERIAQILAHYTKGKANERVTVDFSRGNQRRAVTIVPDHTLPVDQLRIQ